jgi:hypothetical protein
MDGLCGSFVTRAVKTPAATKASPRTDQISPIALLTAGPYGR